MNKELHQLAVEAADKIICVSECHPAFASAIERIIEAALEKAEKLGWERGYSDALKSPFDAAKDKQPRGKTDLRTIVKPNLDTPL